MRKQRVLITGGTGFIGRALCCSYLNKRYEVWVLSRHLTHHDMPHGTHLVVSVDDIDLEGAEFDVIINLAGEPLNAKRWNTQQKSVIRDSRIRYTEKLIEALKLKQLHTKVWINGSAIGWYGHSNTPCSEHATRGSGFAAELCQDWEHAAQSAETIAQRVVLLRIGIVLESGGGPLKAMLTPFKLGLGGRMGSGQQIWSWIHRKDLIRLIHFIEVHEQINGAINGAAPNPVSQQDFAKTLGKALKRPTFAPMPAVVSKLMMGEFANEVLLNGQCVLPIKAQRSGFRFQYTELGPALEDILD